DEKQFNQAIEEAIASWKPFAEIHSAKLVGIKKWSSSTVNAQATRNSNKWEVTIFGGLGRRPEMTLDGLTLVTCHEIGHHFAGYAFYEDQDEWAASEGESDYFATHVCAQALWGSETAANAKFRSSVSPTVKAKCDAVWAETHDQNLCYRIAEAGLSLGKTLASLTHLPEPDFNKPDPSEVEETFTDHPKAQCRLDTYFNGGLCAVQFDTTVIPGLKNPAGQNSPDAEEAAFKYSCSSSAGFKAGFRPRCWFKPKR
ncbi:MAG: hypothetical protein AABZ55_04440, partial [Bdellovibrionota bacterium]